MSSQIISVAVLILVNVLPYLGITVESEALEGAIQTIVTLIAGIVIWYKRLHLKEVPLGEKSDVNLLGVKK